MARTAKGGLSEHPQHGFRITIGKKPDGKPRLFWLGKHRGTAEHHATLLRAHFEHGMKQHDRDVWTEADLQPVNFWLGYFKRSMLKAQQQYHAGIAGLEEARQEIEEEAAIDRQTYGYGDEPTPTPPSPEPAKSEATLYGAIKAYVETLAGKRVSDAHRWRAKQILETTLKGIRQDCPLSTVDYLWLDRLCDHFKSRPKVTKAKRPMSPETVVTTLRYLRTFFNWIDDTSFGGWIGPRKLLRPFRVRAADLMTPTELRDATVIEQFDAPTLVKLYHEATDFQRMLMLAALFTGGTQQELAVLTKAEFDLDDAKLIHYRNKTRVHGSFWLPPQLVDFLRDEFAKHPKKPLAFYTAEDHPLVWFKDGKLACDSVRLGWDRLRKRAAKTDAKLADAPSFKYLRKFAGDYATRHGGEAIGQVALCHARDTVLARNYSTARDFDTLTRIQKQMHAELTAAGMFQPQKIDEKQLSKAA